jgi:group I intron endonuclease
MDCGIYKIENLLTGDFYIGQSINLKKREVKHFWDLEHKTHFNRHLQNAYNKYGLKNFVFHVLLYCEKSELSYYEQKLVDKLVPAYNIRRECTNSALGVVRSPEFRKKVSEGHKGLPAPNKGKKMSDEQRLHISKATMGHNHFVSEETKQKISKGKMGKKIGPLSEETRKKMSLAHTGKKIGPMSKEQKLLISKTKTGTVRGPMSEETKLKISKGNTGKIRSEETRQKISITKRQVHKINLGGLT